MEVKGQSIGLVTAILDGESQMSKEVTDYILSTDCLEDAFPGYPCCCSSDSGAVIGPFSCVIQQYSLITTQINSDLNIELTD